MLRAKRFAHLARNARSLSGRKKEVLLRKAAKRDQNLKSSFPSLFELLASNCFFVGFPCGLQEKRKEKKMRTFWGGETIARNGPRESCQVISAIPGYFYFARLFVETLRKYSLIPYDGPYPLCGHRLCGYPLCALPSFFPLFQDLFDFWIVCLFFPRILGI